MRFLPLPFFSSSKSILLSVFTAALLLVVAAPQARALGPHGDLSAAYGRLWSDGNGYNGWQIDGSLKVAPFLSAEASVDRYSDVAPGSNGYLYLFGPKVRFSVANAHLFAHFLVGGEDASGSSSFIYGGGGGADLSFFPHLAWRFEGDGFHEPNTSTSAGRFVTGPVLRF